PVGWFVEALFDLVQIGFGVGCNHVGLSVSGPVPLYSPSLGNQDRARHRRRSSVIVVAAVSLHRR
ncbi:MAG: hypothetical protein ACR2QK_12415, partial [Acidimicrobiales bacterium]